MSGTYGKVLKNRDKNIFSLYGKEEQIAEDILKKDSYLNSIKGKILSIRSSIANSLYSFFGNFIPSFLTEEQKVEQDVEQQEELAEMQSMLNADLETEKQYKEPIKEKLKKKIKRKIIEKKPIDEPSIIEEVKQEIENEKTELDLGCNVIDDEDEDDENEDNEICKISFNKGLKSIFTENDFNNAKNNVFPNNIETILNNTIKRVSSSRSSSRQQPTLEKMLFDIVNRLYGSGKFKAERTNDNTIIINKANNLIEEINNTLSSYIYTDNTPIVLSDSDILILLLYGVGTIFNNIERKFKLELPKPKLRKSKVSDGYGNTEKFYRAIECKTKTENCGLFSELTKLYSYISNASNKKDLIRSIILWFDTHHDFKESRYEKAVNVWKRKYSNDGTLISWYVDKFFTTKFNPLNPEQKYSFSKDANDTILRPVIEFSKNNNDIPTQLYKISVNYLQNKDFEKSMLLHYIVHNFSFGNMSSQSLLKDILFVHEDTYKNLINNIKKEINDISQNAAINPIEKKKIEDKANIKLNKLTTFFKDFPFETGSLNADYVKDAGTSSFPLGEKIKYVPGALFDANKSNTYEPENTKNTQYDGFYPTEKDVRLNTTYNYKKGGCKLEITGPNSMLSKADIRCSVNNRIYFPDDTNNKELLIKYLKKQDITIEKDSIFIDKMYEMLMKFVEDKGNFAIEGTSLKEPKYFNSIKVGPSVQELVFLIIFYRLKTPSLTLKNIDDIVNLKRLGDYGQVIDSGIKNLPFFTIDSMESLMCLIEDVSCYIDFNQGIIIYYKSNGGFIKSKTKGGYTRVK